jgi:hypothetical protein
MCLLRLPDLTFPACHHRCMSRVFVFSRGGGNEAKTGEVRASDRSIHLSPSHGEHNAGELSQLLLTVEDS